MPFTVISMRTASDRIGALLASRASTTIWDCEAPSCGNVSGNAWSVSDVASSEGPLTGGASVLWTVQAEAASEHRRSEGHP